MVIRDGLLQMPFQVKLSEIYCKLIYIFLVSACKYNLVKVNFLEVVFGWKQGESNSPLSKIL